MKAIFGEKWSHPSTWHAFCSNVRKGKIFKCFFFFFFMCGGKRKERQTKRGEDGGRQNRRSDTHGGDEEEKRARWLVGGTDSV